MSKTQLMPDGKVIPVIVDLVPDIFQGVIRFKGEDILSGGNGAGRQITDTMRTVTMRGQANLKKQDRFI